MLGEKILKGERAFATSFNFGPQLKDNLNVLEVGNLAHKSWDQINLKIETADNQKHEANLLMLDISKANNELGWKPNWDIETSISMTIEWYKDFYLEKKINTTMNLNSFLAKYCSEHS